MKVLIACFLCFVVFTYDAAGSPGARVRRFTQMDAFRETKFWLYTRKNREFGQPLRDGDQNSVYDSYFNPDWPTRILIHGFASKKNSTFNRAIKGAYLDKGDFNVIVVDWSKLAGTKKTVYNYPTIAGSVQHIGLLVGSFAQFLWNDFNIPFDNMYLVGHSLGAHIAGFAANYVRPQKFNTIFALDPAGPTFDPHKKEDTIDSEDAVYVESIQTNLGHWGTLNLGQSQNIGKAAFYPNFGDDQPGCSSVPTCSHSRAYKIFAESINRDIVAKKCSGLYEIFSKDCTSGEPLVYIGGEPSRKDREGVFYLKSNNDEPFATNEYAKAEHLVSFWYYSKYSFKGFGLSETVQALTEASFFKEWPTRIIICDYVSKSSTAFTSCQGIREAYFAKGNYNIIQVDWSIAASSGLFKKDVFSDDIGNITAQLTLILRDVFHVPLNTVYIIGAGTGAQIAHYSAKAIVPDKYDTFFVLDYDKPIPMDGTAYLEAIQTSSNTWHAGATFFPNRGGTKKCNYSCQHELAYKFFKDSITGSAFSGNECLGIRGTEQNVCIRRVVEKTYKMGGDPSTHKDPGPYYRSTKLD